jgi:hypothetical protein
MQNSVRLMAFSVILFFTTMKGAIACPDGSSETSVDIINPRTGNQIHFSCKNETRREFIEIDQNISKKIVATAFKKLNEETGEESLALNTLNTFKDEVAVQFEKFDPSGKLERFEKYKNQKITLKYIEKAQRLEEFSNSESEDSKLIRECYFDFEDQKIKENLLSGVIMSVSLLVSDVKDDLLSVTQELSVGKNKLLHSPKSLSEREFQTSKFNIEYCLIASFFPKNITGEVIYKKQNFILLKEGVALSVLSELIKNNDEKNLQTTLESASESIHHLESANSDDGTTDSSSSHGSLSDESNNATATPINDNDDTALPSE